MNQHILIIVLVAMLMPAGLTEGPSDGPAAIAAIAGQPDHEQILQELLAALRAGDRAAADGFLNRHFGGTDEDGVANFELMRKVLGPDFRFHHIMERSEDRIAGLVSDPTGQKWTGVILEFRGAEGSLTGMALRRAAAPDATSLTPESREAVVRDAASWLRRGYVIPELGPRMADTLLASLKSGAYDSIESTEALALRLTDDLRDVYKDLHLSVLSPAAYEHRKALEEHGFVAAAVEDSGKRHRWYEHGGIADLWWQESGRSVGVIRFSRLIASPEAFDTVRRALREVSSRDGIILDLRGVPGHEGSMVGEIISHFVQQRSKTGESELVEPSTGKRSLRTSWVEPGELAPAFRGKPCYVLVDQDTASAAEALAKLMRRLGGATLVGESTAGAGHMVTTVGLEHEFGLKLPTGRAIDGTSPEGSGIVPDVEVASADALPTALRLLGVD